MKIKDKKIIPVGIGLLVLALGLVFAYPILPKTSTPSVANFAGVPYHGYVCVSKYDSSTKTWSLVSCQHNTLNNGGKDLIESALNGTGKESVLRIGVANCTTATPSATDTAICNSTTNEWTLSNGASACGLANATGTWVVQNAAQGQWNVTKTFTSSCASVTVNATALYNDSLGNGLANTMFAETTFTTTTLNNNDQLNITWGVYIS